MDAARVSRVVFLPDTEMREALERYRDELGLRSANAAARALVATALQTLERVSVDTALMKSVVNEARSEMRSSFLEAVTRVLADAKANE